jgi:Zn-dependent M28 family amino/carboxypeptidase
LFLAAQMATAPPGTMVSLEVERGDPQVTATWNAVGMIRGTDAKLKSEAILLSAHLDGQGVGSGAGDQIFNSADDDASGVVTALGLARLLADGPKPRRTIIFAFYGSEEEGGYGSQSFREDPPVPLEKMIVNLQFEMVGRPDPKVGDKLWLTGYERSTLGPMLAKQGAPIVADPYPEQNFFQRSDNYGMARMGVVAHTVSSFGLHADYHQPGDEASKIDFGHMARAVRSLVGPVEWLANNAVRPEWKKGQKP